MTIDWDDAFDNTGYVAGAAELPARWAARAASFRQRTQRRGLAELDLVYGQAPRNRFDLFRAPDGDQGLIVFVHGGYWQRLDKSFWSHLAAGSLRRGWAVAMPSYSLAPGARIAQMTAEITRAITVAAGQVGGPIRLIGHSAGGHLVMRMICDDSALPDPILARLARVVSVSGIHDLRPLLATGMNRTLAMTDSEATQESPLLHSPQADVPASFWVGAGERPELIRQTRLIAERWQRMRAGIRDHYEPGRDHFSVIDALALARSALMTELLR